MWHVQMPWRTTFGCITTTVGGTSLPRRACSRQRSANGIRYGSSRWYHIQAYLNGALLLDHRDARYRAGQVGLWTKADSITAFDDFVVRGVHAGR